MQFLSSPSKIFPSQKTADIILLMLTSLDFVVGKEKKSKKLRKRVKIAEVKIHIS